MLWYSYKYEIIKFWYTVASCRIFRYEFYYDAWIHEHQTSTVRQAKHCQTQDIPNVLTTVFFKQEIPWVFCSKNVILYYRINEFFIEWTENEDEEWPFHEEKQKGKKNIAKYQGTKASGALSTLCSLIFFSFLFFILSRRRDRNPYALVPSSLENKVSHNKVHWYRWMVKINKTNIWFWEGEKHKLYWEQGSEIDCTKDKKHCPFIGRLLCVFCSQNLYPQTGVRCG